VTIFLAISVGFAMPYICFLIFPNIIKIFPKPGNWMSNFRIFLGLLLLLTLAWLLSLLKINLFLILLLIISIIIVSLPRKKIRSKIYFTSAIILIFLLFIFNNQNNEKLKWEIFSTDLLESYVKSNKLIFVDVTADWCITCQLNKLTTLDSKIIYNFFSEKNVKLLRADWTNKNESILDFISKYDRYGIPVNIIYYKNNKDGILLPEILSQDIVIEEINKVLNEN
jgi:suppressor for copper-sensitivity B